MGFLKNQGIVGCKQDILEMPILKIGLCSGFLWMGPLGWGCGLFCGPGSWVFEMNIGIKVGEKSGGAILYF